MADGSITRREFVRAGTVGVAGSLLGATAPVAAQSGGLSSWFENTSNYESVVDKQGQSEVTVEVGVQANSGRFGFGPAAVRVDPGTTVTFEWVSNDHNIVVKSQPEGANWEGTPGPPSPPPSKLYETGYTYTHTFETEGIYKYYCAPHLPLGMKGAIVVGDVNVGGSTAVSTTNTGDVEPGTSAPLVPLAVGGVVGTALLGGAAWWYRRASDASPAGGDRSNSDAGSDGGSAPGQQAGKTGRGADVHGRSPGNTPAKGSPDEAEDQPSHVASDRSGGADDRPGPPDRIPSAPSVTVDYDRLTDREPIGAGGNADVSKATLPTPDGNVTLAIKRPRMAGTLHSDQVERMLQEAETWDKLDDHDHIVGVVDYGSEPIPWIAMEYMDGGHLGDRTGEMDVPQALWTAIAVTKGARHAHTRGVAHLDLKPANVLFRTVEDAWDVPKVADWGLSKHLLEHSKSVEGMSPHYAAPEQFEEGYGSTDHITDVYQLGAVFYELFTGEPPFDGSPTKVMRAVLADQPRPPSEVADVPKAMDDILLTALAKAKDDRYESMLYFRDALQEVYDAY